MTDISAGLARRLPSSVKAYVPKRLKNLLRPVPFSRPKQSTVDALDELMTSNYQVSNLVGIDRASFRSHIEKFLGMEDADIEGFEVPEQQRGYATKFYWSHYHDFGDFVVDGMERDRHEALIATFMDVLPVLPPSLEGREVLDIGCWTGGTSLLLAALGASVVAVEEVAKYTQSLTFLRDSFDVKNLDPRNLSLYDLQAPEWENRFDYVLFGGVLYHLSDPILGLRIIFNALRPGGKVLLETATAPSALHDKRVLGYGGTDPFGQRPPNPDGGRLPNPDVLGASWFFPSLLTLREMMIDVGFADVEGVFTGADRASAVGTKKHWVDMMRAGLSARNIR